MTHRLPVRAPAPLRVARPLLLLALLLIPAAHAARNANTEDLARAQEKISLAQQRVESTRGVLTANQSRLRDAEKAVARVTTAMRELRRQERTLTTALAKLEIQRNALVMKTQAQATALARDVRAAWLLARQQQLRMWLNANDPQQVARIVRYYDYLQRDRTKRIAEYHEATASLAATRMRVVAEQRQLAETRAKLAAHERELAQARDERKQAVGKLAGELRARSDELKRLREDAAALRRLSNTAREAFRDLPPEATDAPLKARKGKLRWPVVGRIAARYGSPLAEGKLSLNGILIAAPEGSEVRAVHPGRVVYADWLRGYGLLAIIDHGDGYLTIYGHNQALNRATGDWVKEGETIATVGASGGNAAPGLYFELRHGGDPQNPTPWLRR